MSVHLPRSLPFSLALLVACAPSRPKPEANEGQISFVRLGDGLDDAVEMGRGSGVGSTADGAIFVASELGTELLMQVDSTGRKLRTVGAIGQGPGEYPSVSFVLTKGDSVLVQSYADGVFRVYTSAGEYVRSFRSPILMGAGRGVAVRGDTLVLVERFDAEEAFGLPIHLVTSEGAVVKSFGADDDRSVDQSFSMKMIREVAAESDSSFWVARRDRYTLELWNTAGVRERVLDLQRDWFPPVTKNPGDPRYERPSTILQSVTRTPTGHLMVVMLRAVAGWQPEPMQVGRPTMDVAAMVRQYQYVIEVLDAKTGEVLASEVKDHTFGHDRFLANGLSFGPARSSETGAAAPAFWRVTYHPKPPSPGGTH